MDHERPQEVPVRDASTVMLLRDGNDGLEVCLMQRNLDSDFVGGAYVFPGGGVDDSDRQATVAEMCVGLGDAEASRRLGTASCGLAFWVAAIRESFEEAGVLTARHADGSPLTLGDPRVADRFANHRTDVDGAERTIEEIAREEDIRFFVAAVPADQEVVHDDQELISTDWLTPDEALRRHDAGEIVMIFPTVTESDHGVRILLPGDPEGTGGAYDPWTARPLSS